MPFVATWVDLEMIILSEIGQTEKGKYIILFICALWKKKDTNELISKTERDSQTQKTNLPLPKGKQGWGEG